MKKDCKILVAIHKKYETPKSDLYMPIQVGASGKEDLGFLRDDTGENISTLNPYFCELTGIYWAWKNLKNEYIGLVHYRRYFSGKEKFVVNSKTKKILSEAELEKKLEKADVIFPKKRKYYIETLYSHYKHTMFIEPLDKTGEIIREKYPDYFSEFEKLKKRRSAHIFNVFVMKKEILDSYCEWLFDILFELKKNVNEKEYNSFHARFYGRISELLLDVWINTNKIKYVESKLTNIEKINWWKKGTSFLKAKFGGKKYEKSF